MELIRSLFLLAICGISCCYSLRVHQLDSSLQDSSIKISPEAEIHDYELFKTKYFEQKVDHFNEGDTRKWKQEYIEHDKYYQKNGPVYLRIEGSKLPRPYHSWKGYWVTHAEKNKAMLFSINHRFHFISKTLGNTSLANLDYLSASQALQDCVEFIKSMNEEHKFPENTKWIVFGLSYGGNLAAWMRTKYPDLVHGAVASSAPVLAQMDFPEYLDNVENSIESYNKKCREDIALANEKLDELVKTKEGRKEIGNTFKLCKPLDGDSLSTSLFMHDMTRYISNDVENDLDNEKLKKMCNTLKKDSDMKTPFQRYAGLMKSYLKEYRQKCLRTNFDAFIRLLRKVDWFSSCVSGRTWVYQLCTEFGWFPITGPKSKTFSKNIKSEFFSETCSKVFKPTFNNKFISSAVAYTNRVYGGQTLNRRRTLFVQGSSDPWRNLTIQSTKNNKNVEVITIKGGTHASDSSHRHVKSTNKNRQVAIDKIMTTLDTWLKESK